MANPKWYVVQVQSGQDQKMCQVITGLCAEFDQQSDQDGYHLIEECFSPRFRTQHKRMGKWVDIEHPLLPGYVIAVTSEPEVLDRLVRAAPDFARVLRFGETYVPLSSEECDWLDKQTQPGDRVMPMSVGYKRGDKLVVTEGPLVNHEWMIDRVSRSKSLAHLELHVGQMTFKMTVGLAIVPEAQSLSQTIE